MDKKRIKLGVFGILRRDGKTLLGRRVVDDTSFPGLWCHPGGGIEVGEHHEKALCREFKEEVGIAVDVLPYLGVHEYHTEVKHTVLVFREVSSDGVPQAGDGFSEVGWFTDAEVEALAAAGQTTPLTVVAHSVFKAESRKQGALDTIARLALLNTVAVSFRRDDMFEVSKLHTMTAWAWLDYKTAARTLEDAVAAFERKLRS